ncbi:hypothetical protein [Acidiferrobacter thiooxydans]|uniref:hypothetical protein n=1 Tax=Acidiferrobacter thiooxydans TaxID=163359 RepID=UPI003B979B20
MGVKMNVALAESMGLTINHGIIWVDALQRSRENKVAFAVGDCAYTADCFTRRPSHAMVS